MKPKQLKVTKRHREGGISRHCMGCIALFSYRGFRIWFPQYFPAPEEDGNEFVAVWYPTGRTTMKYETHGNVK